MYRLSWILSVCVLCGSAARTPAQVDSVPAILTPYIDEQTVAVGRLDIAKLDLNALFKQVVPNNGESRVLDAAKESVAARVADLRKAGVGTVYIAVNMADLSSNPVCLIVPLSAGVDAAKVIDAMKRIPGSEGWHLEAKGGAVLAGSSAAVARMKTAKPSARPDLAAALGTGRNAAFQIAFAPTADLRRTAEETMPELPKEVGGGPIRTFSRGLIWAGFNFEVAPKLGASFLVQSADAETAKKIRAVGQAAIKRVMEDAVRDDGDARETFTEFAGQLKFSIDGDRLTVRADDGLFATVGQIYAKKIKPASQRAQSSNNLKQIALAMHGYLGAYGGRFATDILGKDGKPLLSWRVRLLPFLEQKALYDQFKLDEPWNSEANRKLIAKIPAVFAAPGQNSAAGTTTYLGPLGVGYLFRSKAKEGLKISDITDGTSNTIMVVEASDAAAVEWSRPGDWIPDPKDPMKLLLGHYPQGTPAAFCDGFVRFLSKKTDSKTILALLTTAGGEVVEIP